MGPLLSTWLTAFTPTINQPVVFHWVYVLPHRVKLPSYRPIYLPSSNLEIYKSIPTSDLAMTREKLTWWTWLLMLKTLRRTLKLVVNGHETCQERRCGNSKGAISIQRFFFFFFRMQSLSRVVNLSSRVSFNHPLLVESVFWYQSEPHKRCVICQID